MSKFYLRFYFISQKWKNTPHINIFIKAALNLLKFSFWFSAFALEQEKIYSWNDQAHNKYIQICYMQLLLPQKWSLPTEQDCYPLDKTLEEETWFQQLVLPWIMLDALRKDCTFFSQLLWKIFLPRCYINRVLKQQWVILNRSCLLYLG